MGTVCLFGPDGSGKTTLARMLKDFMQAHGVRATTTWVRGTHTIASLIARVYRAALGNKVIKSGCNPYYSVCVRGHSKHVWSLLEVIGVSPLIIARFILASRIYDLVIAERSPPDFIVWLFLTFGGEPPPALALSYALSVTSKVCDKVVYVTADPKALMRRRPEDTPRILLSLSIYEALAKFLGAPTIDTTTKTPEESLAELLEVIDRDVAKY